MAIDLKATGERCFALQVMDRLAYVPVVGTVIGVARLVGSLTACIIAGVAYTAAPCAAEAFRKKMEEFAEFTVIRAAGEAERGWSELVPIMPVGMDCGTSDTDSRSEFKGRAHGRYFNISTTGEVRYTYGKSEVLTEL